MPSAYASAASTGLARRTGRSGYRPGDQATVPTARSGHHDADRTKDAHPPPMLNELLPVYLIQPRYSNELALGVDEAIPHLLVLPPHGLEHDIRARRERVREREQRRHARAVSVRRPVRLRLLCLSLCRKLLGKAQRRELARETIHM